MKTNYQQFVINCRGADEMNERKTEMKELKVEDRITIRDNSYCFGIEHGCYSTCCSGRTLRVIKTYLATMKKAYGSRGGEYTQINDLLVTDDAGNFWFTQSRFAESIERKHTIDIDGKQVVLSHQSFENLKKQLLD